MSSSSLFLGVCSVTLGTKCCKFGSFLISSISFKDIYNITFYLMVIALNFPFYFTFHPPHPSF